MIGARPGSGGRTRPTSSRPARSSPGFLRPAPRRGRASGPGRSCLPRPPGRPRPQVVATLLRVAPRVPGAAGGARPGLLRLRPRPPRAPRLWTARSSLVADPGRGAVLRDVAARRDPPTRASPPCARPGVPPRGPIEPDGRDRPPSVGGTVVLRARPERKSALLRGRTDPVHRDLGPGLRLGAVVQRGTFEPPAGSPSGRAPPSLSRLRHGAEELEPVAVGVPSVHEILERFPDAGDDGELPPS